MNPLYMLQMFMGNFGFGRGCHCSGFPVIMPNADILPFLNTPIFRDPSYDFLLNPELALKQCQMNYMNQGGFGGITMLPGFQYPPIGGFTPWTPGGYPTAAQPQKTEEEKKAEEKRKAEAEKPDAKTAAKMYEAFNGLKKLAEDSDSHFTISEELSKQAEEAMKKETAAEQLTAMKTVFEAIPEKTLRKYVLSNDVVRTNLRKAGYNFNYAGNEYSFANKDITDGSIDNKTTVSNINKELSAKKDFHSLGVATAILNDSNNANTFTLGFISTWNDITKNKDKRIIKLIASYLPQDSTKEVAKIEEAKMCVSNIVSGLNTKASNYDITTYPKIGNALEEVQNAYKVATENFTKTNLNKLSDACDKLYLRLRMQEAVKIRDSILNNRDFKYLNDVKPGVLNDNLIVEETIKDLKAEGYTDSEIPALTDLDEEVKNEEITIRRNENNDADNTYTNKQTLVDEYLVKEKDYLSKVSEDSNVYKTTFTDNEIANLTKYFTVTDDNKLVEVFPKADGSGYERKEDAEEVTATEIGNYNNTVNEVKNFIKNKVLKPYEVQGGYKYPVFRATGAKEYYVIKDYKLAKVDVENFSPNKAGFEALTTDECFNFDFNRDDIKSETKVKEDNKAKAEADIKAVEDESYETLAELKTKKVRESIAKNIANDENKKVDSTMFKPLKVNGYFYDTQKKRYYKYSEKQKKLICLKDVKEINEYGIIILKNGSKKPCKEVISDKPIKAEELATVIQEYGKSFAKSVSGADFTNDYNNARRKLYTLILTNDPLTTYHFIKGYQSNCGFFTAQDKGICKQISEESGFTEGEATDLNSKKYYIKSIANLILKMAELTSIEADSTDYQTLEKIANGDLITGTVQGYNPMSVTISIEATSIHTTAEALDNIIEKVLKAYEEILNEEVNDKQ